jgi:hypothetical protein
MKFESFNCNTKNNVGKICLIIFFFLHRKWLSVMHVRNEEINTDIKHDKMHDKNLI